MNFIVEGPDGAGKTTLINAIEAHFGDRMVRVPRAASSVDGPLTGAEMERWFLDDLIDIPDRSRRLVYVYDRHPAISEQVYGSVFRPDTPIIREEVLSHMIRVAASSCYVAFCLPRFQAVRSNVMANDDKQMPGVYENISTIWSKYNRLSILWTGPFMMHNYELPAPNALVLARIGRAIGE